MNNDRNTKKRMLVVAGLLALCAIVCWAQQPKGALRGQLVDELGGVITATTVTLVDSRSVEVRTKTDDRGVFSFEDLPPASYTVKVNARGSPVERQT
jgi:hypothetical protein